VFVACIQLLRHVSELASIKLNDASNDVHAVVRKDKARACVIAVIVALQNILVNYNVMNASDALAVAHYIARHTSLRNTTLWQQWLTSAANDRLTAAAAAMNTTAVSSGSSVNTRNVDDTQAASTTAAAAATTTTVNSTLTATTTSTSQTTVSTAAASTAAASTTATAASSSAIASQDPNITALAAATAEKIKDKFKPQLQRIAVLKRQRQDALQANAAEVAAKKQQYAQIEQRECKKYAALLQQLEHDQQNQHQRVQIEAMQLVKQLTGSL
jgi:hypothetical protein